MKTVQYLECNYFKTVGSLALHQTRGFDVISHESNSYFTDAHEIHVPVGDGDTPLPPRPIALRMRGKCKVRRMTGGGEAISQGVPGGGGAVLGGGGAVHMVGEDAFSNIQCSANDFELMGRVISDACELEHAANSARTHELRTYMRRTRFDMSTQVCMEGMPV